MGKVIRDVILSGCGDIANVAAVTEMHGFVQLLLELVLELLLLEL